MIASLARLQNISAENAIRFLGHPTHTHDVPHLIYVAVGVAHVTVGDETITLRLQESLWLAADVAHSAWYEPGSLVLGPMLSAVTAPPIAVQRLGVVRDITTIMTTMLGTAPATSEETQPFREALDEVLARLTEPHFVLVMPTHPVALRIAREAVQSPLSLDELAAKHGTSVRNVQRSFTAETGLAFHRWRTQARLNVALARLAGGESMGVAARAVGYGSAAALGKAMAREGCGR